MSNRRYTFIKISTYVCPFKILHVRDVSHHKILSQTCRKQINYHASKTSHATLNVRDLGRSHWEGKVDESRDKEVNFIRILNVCL